MVRGPWLARLRYKPGTENNLHDVAFTANDHRASPRVSIAVNYPASADSAQADHPAEQGNADQDFQGAGRRDRHAHGVRSHDRAGTRAHGRGDSARKNGWSPHNGEE